MNRQTLELAARIMVRAAILASHWAGVIRKRALSAVVCMTGDQRDQELVFLRERVRLLETQVSILQKQIHKRMKSPRYNWRERILIIASLEYFKIPRRRVTEYFGIARSTLYRWIRDIDNSTESRVDPSNKTSVDIVNLAWEIAQKNLEWGRVRIKNQLAILGIFLGSSTIRRILKRKKPQKPKTTKRKRIRIEKRPDNRSIPAFYPNHVWGVDLTTVLRWGLWTSYVLVVIDHYSRKLLAAAPLEGPNAGWVCDALEQAFQEYGPPKHIITDQDSVLRSQAVVELLGNWNVKHRFGAIGKHGSIAVVERAIKTLKYEWLKRVPILKGFRHLDDLSSLFVDWYNGWRPHSTLDGACPDSCYCRDLPEMPGREAKIVPLSIERRKFKATGITGFRLLDAA